MKLGELMVLYNQMIEDVDKKWISIIDDISNGNSSKYPEDDNTYAVQLTKGEIKLSETIKLYNNIENIAFYICDTKSKIKVPELGISITYAEEYLNILKNKLFNHHKLLDMITDTGFKIKGILSNGELEVSLNSINRGFDTDAVSESIDFLEKEVEKYESYISKSVWHTEIAFEYEDFDVSAIGIQSNIGTIKNQEEKVDLSEYVSPKEAISKMDEKRLEKFKVKGCSICNSNMRDIIERKYTETEGNVMQTLDYATTKCGLFELTPNMLVNHLDYHNRIEPAEYINQIEDGFNNPDLHTPVDHILGTEHNTKNPINNLKNKNNLKPNTNNPDKHISY